MTVSEVSLPVSQTQPERVHGPRLTGAWCTAGVVMWAAVFLLSLGAFILSTYTWFIWDSTPVKIYALSREVKPEFYLMKLDYETAIRQVGMSLAFYGGLFASLRLLAGLPYFVLSALIIQRRRDRLMAVLFAVMLAVNGAAGRWISPNWNSLPGSYPWTAFPILLLDFILNSSVIIFYTFPDGRFVPRWTRWLALVVLLNSFIVVFLPGSLPNLNRLPGLAGLLAPRMFLLIGLLVQVYRYRHHADADQRQQIKWVVVGASLLGIFYFAHFITYYTPLINSWSESARNRLIYELVLEPGWYVAQALLAVCIGISVFRYRLWDVEVVINRLLVYGSLTLLTMGVYLALVAGIGTLFHNVTGPAVFFLLTGLIAILFEPLRRRLQRLVNRLMYGERDEPYAVLTRLADTLEHSATPGEMLPTMAAMISQALKIPYVSIFLHESEGDHLVARVGKPQEGGLSFPLVYLSEEIGSLRVGQRARRESFSTTDLRLLENISRQAGSAAHAVRLNTELVRSRAGIVTAREEERRRLRRDLHDGLGPILASQTLKMAAVRNLLRQNPEQAESMVDDIIQQNENTVSEVRRLVYGLRPPALDELGLVEAVRDLVHRSQQDGQSITVEGPAEGLPALPAAVEANAYRIALEGLTNAARHAQAQHCTVSFSCEVQPDAYAKPMLRVQIIDDGAGMPENYRAGVGIRSMRERAEELGGWLSIQAANPQGTWVSAWLPLVEWK